MQLIYLFKAIVIRNEPGRIPGFHIKLIHHLNVNKLKCPEYMLSHRHIIPRGFCYILTRIGLRW